MRNCSLVWGLLGAEQSNLISHLVWAGESALKLITRGQDLETGGNILQKLQKKIGVFDEKITGKWEIWQFDFRHDKFGNFFKQYFSQNAYFLIQNYSIPCKNIYPRIWRQGDSSLSSRNPERCWRWTGEHQVPSHRETGSNQLGSKQQLPWL